MHSMFSLVVTLYEGVSVGQSDGRMVRRSVATYAMYTALFFCPPLAQTAKATPMDRWTHPLRVNSVPTKKTMKASTFGMGSLDPELQFFWVVDPLGPRVGNAITFQPGKFSDASSHLYKRPSVRPSVRPSCFLQTR